MVFNQSLLCSLEHLNCSHSIQTQRTRLENFGGYKTTNMYFMTGALIVLSSLIIFSTYIYLKKHFHYWKRRNVPFIKPKFPYGNFEEVTNHSSSIGDFVANMYRQSKDRFVGIWVFSTPHLVVRCPDLIKMILVKDFKHFYDRTIVSDEKVDPICSQMLFLVKSPKWKKIRNQMTMLFTGRKLKNMFNLMDEAGKTLGHYLFERGDCAMETRELFSKYSTDVIVSCAFGLEARCFEEENSPFRVVSRKISELNFMNGIRFVSYFFVPPLVKILRICFLDPFCIKFLKKAVWDTIKERETTGKVRHDMIDTLMELRKKDVFGDGKHFDGDQVVAQPVQIFFGGFETTSTTMSFATYELALNQQIQDKVRAEIKGVYDKYGCINYDNVKYMPYLDKVVSETLRKYPVLSFLDRRCMESYKIPGTSTVIEKGTPIYISVLGLHYDPQYYPNPHVFDPERFSGDAIASSNNYYYLPFGSGPRNCIGARFGLISSKVGLANLLSRFRVEKCEKTPETIKFDPKMFLLTPRDSIFLRFIPLQDFID